MRWFLISLLVGLIYNNYPPTSGPVGGLLKNTYSSFSLETGTEQMIASGIGVYYVSNTYFDSVSNLVVMDYDSAYVLGDDYRVEFRVEEAKLYATAKNGNQDIRIRKIAIK